MKNYYFTKIKTCASFYDSNFKFKFDEILTIMQDLATAHSYDMQTDHDTLLKNSNAFWVLTRAKFKINFSAKNNSYFYAKTWPLKPSGVRFLREYSFKQNSLPIIEGRSEWCVLDANDFSIKKPQSICYPHDLNYLKSKSLTPDFLKISCETNESDFCYDYKVLLCDIDCNKHTNNVSYAKMALNTFTIDEFNGYNFTTFEIKFIKQTFFNDKISIYKKSLDENSVLVEGKINGNKIFYVVLSK